MRGNRGGRSSRSVREDWLAWIPNEMDQLFEATRCELESSNIILSITLDEALALCKRGQSEYARESAVAFGGLFDRLAMRICRVIQAVQDHGSRFGTLPSVKPLAAANFRGEAAQRISFMNNMLAKVLFRERTRFFHKLHCLDEIVAELQKQTCVILAEMPEWDSPATYDAWTRLEVLAYDLNTCMEEAIILLKSFFCALPSDELETFRRKLADPAALTEPFQSGRPRAFHRK